MGGLESQEQSQHQAPKQSAHDGRAASALPEAGLELQAGELMSGEQVDRLGERGVAADLLGDARVQVAPPRFL